MALNTGKTLDQYKNDYETAQREYNSLLKSDRLVSPSSLEHAKAKMDLASADYGQAQRMQSSTPSVTYGTKDTPLLNEYLAGLTKMNFSNTLSTNTGSPPKLIINTSAPIVNPALIGASKATAPPVNTIASQGSPPAVSSSNAMDNTAHTPASSQNTFRGGYGSLLNTGTYRTAIGQSVIDADPMDYYQIKNNYDSAKLKLSQLQAQGAHGTRTVFQNSPAYKQQLATAQSTYDTAEKAYNDALKIHNDAEMAKTINADVSTLNQLESVKNNADFLNRSTQGKQENHKLFDNYAPSVGMLKRGETVGAGEYDNIDYMTPDEQNVYAYLLVSDKPKAKQYINALTRTLNYRSMSDYLAMVRDQSQKSSLQGFVYNALGNAEKPLALVGTAVQAVDDLVSGKSEPLDNNSGYFIGNRTADTSEKALIDKAKTPTGKWWTSELLGVSNAVPIVAASIINPELGLTIMSSEAAGDAAYSVAERGGTAAQAATSGVIVGGMQYLLGKMPVGKLSEIKNTSSAITVKNVLNDYGKQLLPVATMNAMSVLTNNLTDQMVMGNKSAMNGYARQLEAQGMSEQDALKKAITEFYGKHLISVLEGSAFQAGVFTGGAETFKGINKPNIQKPASPDTIFSGPPKESPHLSGADDSAYTSNTSKPQKNDEELFSDIYYEKKAEALLNTYKEFLKTNSFDQNKAEGYNEGAGDAGKIADGGNNARFTYKNNPMDNPKVGKDIIENPKAVYGYSPDPSSERIGRFAEFDWTNNDVVARAREARLQYHKDNESMYNIVKGMQHNGSTVEEIARAANQQRNVNRLQSYIYTGNMSGYEKAVESNMRIFHNKLGMTADQAFAKYGSWDIALEKAMSANAGMDACCGLYDDFYYLYSTWR